MLRAVELLTETFEYDGGRGVTVCLPSGPPEAVVFAGDGQLISQWGDVLAAARAPIHNDHQRPPDDR
jgi:hypothetical protein